MFVCTALALVLNIEWYFTHHYTWFVHSVVMILFPKNDNDKSTNGAMAGFSGINRGLAKCENKILKAAEKDLIPN